MIRFIHFMVCIAAVVLLSTGQTTPPREANIAYFIQISESTITLLPRLMKVLRHPKNLYIVHFDLKIPKWQRDYSASFLLEFMKDSKNMLILPSEVITYRGISMVINSMNAMQMAMDAPQQWDYFINLSGSDYPLASPQNQRILLGGQDFLDKKRNFLTVSPRPWWGKSKEYRFSRLFTDTSMGMKENEADLVDSYTAQPLYKRLGFEFVAAESWMILHRSFVRFLLTSGTARRYFAAFSYAAEPEEHFFVSLAYNVPRFNDTMVHDALRNVVWRHNGKHSGQHPYNVDLKDEAGNFMLKPRVQNSGCLFTRKIKVQDSKFLDWIDKELSGTAKDVDQKSVDKQLTRIRRRLHCLHPDKRQRTPIFDCSHFGNL